MRDTGLTLLDVQWTSRHLESLGVVAIRVRRIERLRPALGFGVALGAPTSLPADVAPELHAVEADRQHTPVYARAIASAKSAAAARYDGEDVARRRVTSSRTVAASRSGAVDNSRRPGIASYRLDAVDQAARTRPRSG